MSSIIARPCRVLYNFDGNTFMYTKPWMREKTFLTERMDFQQAIREITSNDSCVDTVVLCVYTHVTFFPMPNIPSQRFPGTFRGDALCAGEKEELYAKGATGDDKFWHETWLHTFGERGEHSFDPFKLMLRESKNRGKEAIISIRMNDHHNLTGVYRSKFWREHRDFRWDTNARKVEADCAKETGFRFDYRHPEVREYMYGIIEAAVEYYKNDSDGTEMLDGIELDFNRSPALFVEGSGKDEHEKRIASEDDIKGITAMVEMTRTMLIDVGKSRKRQFTLGVIAASNFDGGPPSTPASTRLRGCDVVYWAKQRLIDYVTVMNWEIEDNEQLEIYMWKQSLQDIPGFPVYAGMLPLDKNKQLWRKEHYKARAKELREAGADGIYLFNFDSNRQDRDPPYCALSELCE